MAKEPIIKYTGKGEYYNTVPARDLTAEDYAALDPDVRALVRDSPLYDYAKYRDAVKAAHDEAAAKDTPKDAPKDAPAPDALAPKAHAPAHSHATKADSLPAETPKAATT